jgi:hypothetical protein
MRRSLLAASLAALALAGGGTAANLPAGWTHAEINFSVGRVPHTLILDRGRVTAVSASALTLREQDGSSVDVALSPSTQVVVSGRPGSVAEIVRGATVTTWRIDGGAATSVRVVLPRRVRR